MDKPSQPPTSRNERHRVERDGAWYVFVYDTEYQTRGSYSYDTEEETKAAEDEEIEKLDSHEWIVVGMRKFEKCDKPNHCDTCERWNEVDSLWGIVLDNTEQAMEQMTHEM